MTQENTATTVATSENLPQAPEQIQSGWTSLVPMVLIFVVFYFLLIRPQEKKRKAQEHLVSTVKPGEDIVTHSGMYGKVSKVNDNDGTVNVEVAKNVEIKVLKSAVGDIVSRKKAAAAKTAVATPTAKATPAPAEKKPDAPAKKAAKATKTTKTVSKNVAKPAAKKPAKKGK